jgi:hypothetical protein
MAAGVYSPLLEYLAFEPVRLGAMRGKGLVATLGDIGMEQSDVRVSVMRKNGPESYPFAFERLAEKGRYSKPLFYRRDYGLTKIGATHRGGIGDIGGLAVAHGKYFRSRDRHL